MPTVTQSVEPSSNAPIHTIRHRNIKVSIWQNETAKGPMHNAILTRSFREDEAWRDSHSFGYDDLMIAAKLLSDAHSYITALRSRRTAPAKPAKRRVGPVTK